MYIGAKQIQKFIDSYYGNKGEAEPSQTICDFCGSLLDEYYWAGFTSNPTGLAYTCISDKCVQWLTTKIKVKK